MFRRLRFLRALAVGALITGSAATANADIIGDWNEAWLDTIRVVGGPPCPIARSQAMVFVAIYDAVNSIDRRYEPYIAYIDTPRPVNKRVAVAAAAHRVLTNNYPARAAIYDELYNRHLAGFQDGPAKANGIALGVASADAVIARRANDRSDENPDYTYQNVPGAYKRTPPDFTSPPFNPGWGQTDTWCMVTGEQFRPSGPYGHNRLDRLLRSRVYARDLNEVKQYGRRRSRVRTPEQTEIAWFWANDRDGTYKPPGHLMYITQVVAEQQRLSLDEKARLFALSAIAQADAGAVAWDMKYSTDVDLWRPITAIRRADRDNNPRTTPDRGWLPLLEFTPPFPAYSSGHATFAAAHAAVMRGFFGTDNLTFTIGTDEPIVADVRRTFTSFSQAARENGLSRVYLGVHFRCDADAGFSSGTLLGNYVIQNFLRPVGCTPDFNRDGQLNSADVRLFTDAYFAGQISADLDRDGDVDHNDFVTFVDLYFAGCEG